MPVIHNGPAIIGELVRKIDPSASRCHVYSGHWAVSLQVAMIF